MATGPHLPTADRFRRTPVTLRNTPFEWLLAFAILAALGLFFWGYQHWWGVGRDSLDTANAALALASTVGIALSLAFGPVYRLLGIPRQSVRMRRPLGLMAFLASVAHVVITVLVIRAPISETYEYNSISLGVASLTSLLMMASTSFTGAVRRLGRRTWRHVQNAGYVVLLLTLAHYLALGRFHGWVRWFTTFGLPDHLPAPSASFVASIVIALVVLLKVADIAIERRFEPAADYPDCDPPASGPTGP